MTDNRPASSSCGWGTDDPGCPSTIGRARRRSLAPRGRRLGVVTRSSSHPATARRTHPTSGLVLTMFSTATVGTASFPSSTPRTKLAASSATQIARPTSQPNDQSSSRQYIQPGRSRRRRRPRSLRARLPPAPRVNARTPPAGGGRPPVRTTGFPRQSHTTDGGREQPCPEQPARHKPSGRPGVENQVTQLGLLCVYLHRPTDGTTGQIAQTCIAA